MPRPVKSGLKWLARTPERLLHPWRRRRARGRLARVAPTARSVLFVCYGNICRSPVAERIFKQSLAKSVDRRLRIESTGFHPEEGRPAPPEAIAAAGRLELDLSDHRSRSLLSRHDREDSHQERIVFVMEPDQLSRYRRLVEAAPRAIFVLGDFDPDPVARRGIMDPFGHSRDVFDRSFERIERCAEDVASTWCQISS